MGDTCRVLLLEDHVDFRVGLSLLLKHRGITVCQAGTVAQALAQLEGQEAAILDMMLPDGSGMDVLARIRREKRPMRVAMLTALSDVDRVALAGGADAFFVKPIFSERLEALLAWATNRA
ncbi:MAG: two component transcriptional regulator, winged helix family [Phycisphaerales bacterium]|jgi:two-component system response regulator QseB|nr:two component transcriptional regulator, winged helix family [Phycisphaerales bacterium]